MNMEEKLDEMIEISDYLKDSSASEQLKRMKQALSDKRYILTVMGQFSAGKSRLINNILDKKVLPVHISETTALLTYVFYSEDEYAELLYKDGRIERITIEDSLDLWQSGKHAENLSDVYRINICVNNELLKNGLTIIDTPGINTIIDKHIEISQNVIESTDRILYVMGKSFTKSDYDFVNGVLADGIEVMFVRTHMDELKTAEEDSFLTTKEAREFLSKFSDDEVFFVSNEENSPYFDGVGKLREYLQDHLACSVEEAVRKNVHNRISFIAKKQMDILTDKRVSINQVLSGKHEEYNRSKKEAEAALDRMNNVLKKNKEDLKRRYEKKLSEAEEELTSLKDREVKNIRSKISSLKINDNSKDLNSTVEFYIKNSCLNLRNNYTAGFDELIKDNKTKLTEEIGENSEIFHIDLELPDDLEESNEYTKELEDKICSLHALQNGLENELAEFDLSAAQNEKEKERLSLEKEELEEAIAGIKEELNNYPQYEEHYIEKKGTHNNEDTWRTVGKVLDWATIFIPGEAWAKVGAKALKLGAQGAKAAKAANIALKLEDGAKILSESAKIAQGIDHVTDGVRIGRNLGRGRKKSKTKKSAVTEKAYQAMTDEEIRKAGIEVFKDYENFKNFKDNIDQMEEKPSFLDYLSLDFYFAKIGKKFDTPDVKIVDEKYKREYEQGKKEIQNRMHREVQAEYNKRRELLDITDKIEQIKLEQEINRKKQAQSNREIEQLEKKLSEEAAKSRFKAIKDFYSDMAEEKINLFYKYLLSDFKNDIVENMEDYIVSYDYRILNDIKRKRKELEDIESQFKNKDDVSLENELMICKNFSNMLEECF